MGSTTPSEESALYHELQEMERSLDWTISRKRMEIQEALGRPVKVRLSSETAHPSPKAKTPPNEIPER